MPTDSEARYLKHAGLRGLKEVTIGALPTTEPIKIRKIAGDYACRPGGIYQNQYPGMEFFCFYLFVYFLCFYLFLFLLLLFLNVII